VDIFWGRGPEAELAASEMKESGELYFVVPRANPAGADIPRR
jgi:membrane-bound lytic murein transglycosylase A